MFLLEEKSNTPILCSPTDKLGFRLVFDMAQLTVAEFRRTLMALAEALSEPGRPFTPDQVMLQAHELNPGQYGTHFAPPKRCLTSSMLGCVSPVVRPLFMNGQVSLFTFINN